MESTAIIGLGAGGHGRVIADILSRSGAYKLASWLDHDSSLHGIMIAGAKVLGDDSMLNELQSMGISHAFIGVGSTGDASLRRKITARALDAGITLPIISDKTALISEFSDLQEGVCIFPHAIINPGCRIGQCTIINTRATLEHDCTVGDHSHLAPACVIGGGCSIGNGAHIGIGAVIKEGITIGENAVVGAGAVVVSHVAPKSTVVGIPAKPISLSSN